MPPSMLVKTKDLSQSPCAFCSKAGLECLYPFTGRMPTRQHNPATASVASVRATPVRKQSEFQVLELLGRLRHLESVVDGMKAAGKGANPETPHTKLGNSRPSDGRASLGTEGEATSSDTGTTGPSHDQSYTLSKSFGSLHICESGTLYTSNGFWATLHGELRSVRKAFETSCIFDFNNPEDGASALGIMTDQIPFTLGQYSPYEQILHPTPHLIPFIWRVYVENVDPFIKVLHVPTMAEIIQLSEDGFEKLSVGMQALVFSISLAAVVSLSETDVQKTFGAVKEEIISRFIVGTEQSLSQVGILKTTELCVAQASLIYLESAGHRYGMRTVWMMSGILVRAAISIGLHRDGATFPNISYFEAEMRRRLWWHICCFDARISQCYAPETIISNNMMDTREPTNINDADLDLNMKQEPIAREGFTDLSIIARVTNIFGKWTPTGETDPGEQSFFSALALIENMRRWRDHSSTSQWGWVLVNYQQWYAIGIILVHLQTRTWDETFERAWALVVEILNGIPPAMMTQNPLRQSIVSMITAARRHREEELSRMNMPPEEPNNVSLLPDLRSVIAFPTSPLSGSQNLDYSAVPQEPLMDTYKLGHRNMELSNTQTVDMERSDSNKISIFQELPHLGFSYPSWYLEPTSHLDIPEPNFGGLQSYFYNSVSGTEGESLMGPGGSHVFPQGQLFGS
ncbi:fungal specific transcription factor domain-containing [Trichoderma arundinaceum]|uniref:Fungal specific transcription factor domain-containing n=1 Tax=Trichoderma arundinaceum TaxID=490622 RepID=A0A395NX08_TRIAR|nr:fungal specific transcription factor domain-containing [Trichoderma arundinaceum]